MKYIYPTDSDGNEISFRTSATKVYDKNGQPLQDILDHAVIFNDSEDGDDINQSEIDDTTNSNYRTWSSNKINEKINVQKSRIDSLAKLTDAGTTGDAELLDIRIKVDGETAVNAGTAVREQFEDVNTAIDVLNDLITNVNPHFGYSNTKFSVSQGEVHSSEKDSIVIGIRTGKEFTVRGTNSTRNLKDSNVFAFYQNGESENIGVIKSNGFGQTFTAKKDIESIGIYLNTDTTDVSYEYEVIVHDEFAYLNENKLSDKGNAIGLYTKDVSFTEGTAHSSDTDVIVPESSLKEGTKIHLSVYSANYTGYVNIFQRYANNTGDSIGTMEVGSTKTFTITKETPGIGLYVDNAKATATLHVILIIEDSITDRLNINEREISNFTNTFKITASTAHNSKDDRFHVDIRKGEKFKVYNTTSNNTRILNQVFAIYTNGNTEACGNSYTGEIYEFVASQDISQIGFYIPAQTTGCTIQSMVFIENSITDKLVSGMMSNKPFYTNNCNADVLNKINEYTKLFLNNSNDIESLLFFTDPHTFEHGEYYSELRMQNSFNTLEYIYQTAPVSNVLCGGDWLTGSDTDEEAIYKLARINGICKAKFGDNFYPILGNYDSNYQGETPLGVNTVKNILFRRFNRNYYKFEGQNTVFYIFDTGLDTESEMSEYRWKQIDWFCNELVKETHAHIAVAFHILTNTTTSDPIVVEPFADTIIKAAKAYNEKTIVYLNDVSYDFSSSVGTVSFCLAGHTHIDNIVDCSGIPCLITKNSSYNATSDLLYIDYTDHKLKTIRIGDGEDRTMNIL